MEKFSSSPSRKRAENLPLPTSLSPRKIAASAGSTRTVTGTSAGARARSAVSEGSSGSSGLSSARGAGSFMSGITRISSIFSSSSLLSVLISRRLTSVFSFILEVDSSAALLSRRRVSWMSTFSPLDIFSSISSIACSISFNDSSPPDISSWSISSSSSCSRIKEPSSIRLIASSIAARVSSCAPEASAFATRSLSCSVSAERGTTETLPSRTATLVRFPSSTSTPNSVPLTPIVAVGVRTSYLSVPARRSTLFKREPEDTSISMCADSESRINFSRMIVEPSCTRIVPMDPSCSSTYPVSTCRVSSTSR